MSARLVTLNHISFSGCRYVFSAVKEYFVPFIETDTISVLYEEYEALRLIDYEGLTHEEAANLMNVSRPTFTRVYNSCLKKIAQGFTEGKSIIIDGGDVEFDKQWFRCNDCHIIFHYFKKKKPVCPKCQSDNIEHINKSIKNWRDNKNKQETIEIKEYCICTSCSYHEPHERGTPCFTKTCPNCKTPLIRKDF